MKLILFFLAYAYLQTTASAASSHDWATLSRALVTASGPQIQVRTVDKKKVRGQFSSVDENGVVLAASGSVQRIPRASVSAVWVQRHPARWRNALIGFAGGGGAAYLIGYAGCGGLKLDCLGKISIGVIAGMAVGTATGATLPGGWREVYRAP